MCGFGTQCVYVYMVAHHCLEAARVLPSLSLLAGKFLEKWANFDETVHKTSSKMRKFEIKRLEKKM